MEEGLYASPQMYYASADLRPVQPVVQLVKSDSTTSNPCASPPSQYAFTDPMEFPSHYSSASTSGSPLYHPSMLISMSQFLPTVTPVHCLSSGRGDTICGVPPLDPRLSISRYHWMEFEPTDKATSFSSNFEMTQHDPLRKFVLATNPYAETIKRACYKYQLCSNDNCANMMLPNLVYDNDFNIGSAI
jgi:hypothetical protein